MSKKSYKHETVIYIRPCGDISEYEHYATFDFLYDFDVNKLSSYKFLKNGLVGGSNHIKSEDYYTIGRFNDLIDKDGNIRRTIIVSSGSN